MHIVFATEAIRDEANTFSQLVDRYGEVKAMKIRQRLDEIYAATTLDEFSTLPASKCRCQNGKEHLVAASTVPPRSIILNISKNFNDYDERINYLWKKVTFVEIMSLDGEVL